MLYELCDEVISETFYVWLTLKVEAEQFPGAVIARPSMPQHLIIENFHEKFEIYQASGASKCGLKSMKFLNFGNVKP